MTEKCDVKTKVKNCSRIFFEMTGVLVQVDPNYLKNLLENIIKKLNGKISDENIAKKFWFEQNQLEQDRIIQNCFDVPISSFRDTLKCIGDDMYDNTISFPDVEVLGKIKKGNTLFSIFDKQPRFKTKNVLDTHKIPFDSVLTFDELNNMQFGPRDIFVVNSIKAITWARSRGITIIFIDRHQTKPNIPFRLFSIESLTELV